MIRLAQDHAEAAGIFTMRPDHQLDGVFRLEFGHIKAVKGDKRQRGIEIIAALSPFYPHLSEIFRQGLE